MLELTENMCDHELVTKARKSKKKQRTGHDVLPTCVPSSFSSSSVRLGMSWVERFAVSDSVCRVQFKSDIRRGGFSVRDACRSRLPMSVLRLCHITHARVNPHRTFTFCTGEPLRCTLGTSAFNAIRLQVQRHQPSLACRSNLTASTSPPNQLPRGLASSRCNEWSRPRCLMQ